MINLSPVYSTKHSPSIEVKFLSIQFVCINWARFHKKNANLLNLCLVSIVNQSRRGLFRANQQETAICHGLLRKLSGSGTSCHTIGSLISRIWFRTLVLWWNRQLNHRNGLSPGNNRTFNKAIIAWWVRRDDTIDSKQEFDDYTWKVHMVTSSSNSCMLQ